MSALKKLSGNTLRIVLIGPFAVVGALANCISTAAEAIYDGAYKLAELIDRCIPKWDKLTPRESAQAWLVVACVFTLSALVTMLLAMSYGRTAEMLFDLLAMMIDAVFAAKCTDVLWPARTALPNTEEP